MVIYATFPYLGNDLPRHCEALPLLPRPSFMQWMALNMSPMGLLFGLRISWIFQFTLQTQGIRGKTWQIVLHCLMTAYRHTAKFYGACRNNALCSNVQQNQQLNVLSSFGSTCTNTARALSGGRYKPAEPLQIFQYVSGILRPFPLPFGITLESQDPNAITT